MFWFPILNQPFDEFDLVACVEKLNSIIAENRDYKVRLNSKNNVVITQI